MSLKTATTQPAPIRFVWSADGSQIVRGPLSDALQAKVWGKLKASNVGPSSAETLDSDDLSDFIDANIVDLVGEGTRHRYVDGAARWAMRSAPMKVAA